MYYVAAAAYGGVNLIYSAGQYAGIVGGSPTPSTLITSSNDTKDVDEEWVMMNLGMNTDLIVGSVYGNGNEHPRIKATIVFQKYIRGCISRQLTPQFSQLCEEKKRILKKFHTEMNSCNASLQIARQEKGELEKKKEEPETGIQEVGFKIAKFFDEKIVNKSPKEELELKINGMNQLIDKFVTNKKEIQERREVDLAACKQKYDCLMKKLKGDVQNSQEKKEKTPPPLSSMEQLFADVINKTHQHLKCLIETILAKARGNPVAKWAYNPFNSKGNFTITLTKPIKLWIRTEKEPGVPDPRTPKGVILMLGTTDSKIEGIMDPAQCKITFTSGFTLFCQWKMGFLGGCADGTIDFIQYDKFTDSIAISTSSVARRINRAQTDVESKKLNFLLESWKSGILVEGDHEAFLDNHKG